MTPKFPLTETMIGFTWGPATVERIASHTKAGVWIEVITPRQRLQVRVSPTGKITPAPVVRNLARK